MYGPWLRYLILASIVTSQVGFVAAYTIFVAQNLQVKFTLSPLYTAHFIWFSQAFVMGITRCIKLIPVQYLILLQLIIFLPLALVRNIAKLGTTALIADAFIFAGLVYIFGSEFAVISKEGIADVKLFNPRDFPLFIG